MRICQELLSYHVPSKAKALRTSRALNYEYLSHSYPITAREERRRVPMNDQSGWCLCTARSRQWRPDRLFIR